MKANRLITRLLALLGFVAVTGCERVEYGSPHAEFELKGKVVDAVGEPVKDIAVKIVAGANAEYELMLGRGTTDDDGDYIISSGAIYGRAAVVVVAEDVDGDENGGNFVTKTQVVEVKRSDFIGGDGNWNLGKATKTLDFTLTEKR